jgi:arylsulfatase
MEKTDISASHPDEVARLRKAYDAWWADVRPGMSNENPQHIPAQNPYKTLYWQQFGH